MNETSTASIFDTIDQKMLSRIQSLRLMDDDFMTVVFENDAKLTEFVLRILLSRDDLTVKRAMTQCEKRNLFGRSVKLDIVAQDTAGKIYNVEIQRTARGAQPKRTRANLCALDSRTLKTGDDFSALPETYIIFITENDIFKQGLPLYKIVKKIEGTSLSFDDGAHIIYVNGEYRENDAVGHLMHDFCTASADDMFYSEIAERVRFHKQGSEGVKTMSKIFEEYGDERVEEARAQWSNDIVQNLLRDGGLPPERISAVANVPLELVRRIAAAMPQ